MIKILGRYLWIVAISVSAIFGLDGITLSMKSSKSSVLVGEPFIVTVIISEKNGLMIDGKNYQKPDFSGFSVTEDKQPVTTITNDIKRTELRYMLTPQNAGSFTISPARVEIVAQNSVQSIDFMGITIETSIPKIENLVSNALNITVKDPNIQTDLIGNFDISRNLSSTSTTANKPVIMTLNISGNGDVDSMRDLNFSIDGVTVYSQKAITTKSFGANEIHSTYKKDYVFIGDHNFTIPAIEISVLNTSTMQVTTKTIPAQNIIVNGSGNKDQEVVISHANNDSHGVPFWLYFIFGVIATLFILFLSRFVKIKKTKQKSLSMKNSLSQLMPYAKEDIEVEEMVKNLYAKQKGNKNIKIDKKKLKELLTKYNNSIKQKIY